MDKCVNEAITLVLDQIQQVKQNEGRRVKVSLGFSLAAKSTADGMDRTSSSLAASEHRHTCRRSSKQTWAS